MIPTGIYATLQALQMGIKVWEDVSSTIENALEENRDLTDEELDALDIDRDTTHSAWEQALANKRAREAGN